MRCIRGAIRDECHERKLSGRTKLVGHYYTSILFRSHSIGPWEDVYNGLDCPPAFEDFKGDDGLTNRAHTHIDKWEDLVSGNSMQISYETVLNVGVNHGYITDSIENVLQTPTYEPASTI